MTTIWSFVEDETSIWSEVKEYAFGNILLETGSILLLESGNVMLQEQPYEVETIWAITEQSNNTWVNV